MVQKREQSQVNRMTRIGWLDGKRSWLANRPFPDRHPWQPLVLCGVRARQMFISKMEPRKAFLGALKWLVVGFAITVILLFGWNRLAGVDQAAGNDLILDEAVRNANQ